MSLFNKIHNLIAKTKKSFDIIKDSINYYSQNKNIVNYILYANFGFIVVFGIMIFFLKQQKISHYFDIREAIGHIKEISEGYELEFTQAQATLRPNIKKINSIINHVKTQRDNIIHIIKNIDDPEYNQSVQEYVSMLDKRLLIQNEIIHQYSELVKLYKDYFIIAKNAENAIGDNLELHLTLKHLMLNLEKIRLMSKHTNREDILKAINEHRNRLVYESPKIQEKMGLYLDTTENIVKLLRYLDTVRSSMDNDGYHDAMKDLRTKTFQAIDSEEFKFSIKLIAFLLLSIIMVAVQFIVLTLFFINKRRTEKLQKEAIDKIQKSHEIADRAKQYALDAQRSQFQLLHNFCSDFDIIIHNISSLTALLKKKITNCNLDDIDNSFIETQNISVSRLDASVIALEKWLNNYLEIYTPKDKWEKLQEGVLNLTDLFDKNFAEARFFMHDRQHLLSIFHGINTTDVISDKEYLFKLFMNMIYVSIKWAENTWLKSSITLRENENINDADDEKKHILTISVVNGASQSKYQDGLELFEKEHDLTENHNNDTRENNHDRFVVASIYYMKQICDVLSANFSFERNIMEENTLNVRIPVRLSESRSDNISVPILKNKNILIVSPYPSILRNMNEQLTQFGLNVTSLSDKYSAIGHIIGASNSDKSYDLFIIEHNPPDIDAESLAKIIRENSSKNLTHIIITTTEEYLPQIEHNKSMYDAIFTKPVMPALLKEKLEEFIEIQLYGTSTDTPNTSAHIDDTHKKNKENKNDICRFLAIMDEDLSSMLLQLVLTKVNYKVDVVTTPAQLYELLDENYYNFILTSNKCTWIIPENLSNDIRRHHSDNKESVIIMIYDTIKDTVIKKLARAGYDDFIQLPLSRSAFLETIENWHDPVEKRMHMAEKTKPPKKSKTSSKTDDNEDSDDTEDNNDNNLSDTPEKKTN